MTEAESDPFGDRKVTCLILEILFPALIVSEKFGGEMCSMLASFAYCTLHHFSSVLIFMNGSILSF